MGDLILDSLEIQNFRAFRHLTIEHLGRINLIVGANGAGKTCLLEALWLYAGQPSYPAVAEALLQARNEPADFRNLTHHTNNDPIHIHPLNSQDIVENKIWGGVLGTDCKAGHAVYVAASGLDAKRIHTFWKNISLSALEDDVIAALRIINPQIQRVGVDVDLENGGSARTIAKVRLKGNDYPVTLASRGEGMNRMLGIVLALVNAKDGLLLIDEIESGLYHGIQADMWRLIFAVARRLNIQVFATTHSWDCLDAFSQAACEDEQTEGMMISLRRKQSNPDDIVAILFDERRLDSVANNVVEVR